MRITEKTLLLAGNMAGDLISAVQQINQQFGYAIQANYATSGTLAGTLQLQCSLDYQEDPLRNVTNVGTWIPIPNSAKVISQSDSPKSYVWNVESVYYPWVKVTYTHAGSDSGSLKILYFGRGF